jgi:hypothetical protein
MPILENLTLTDASRQKGTNRENGFRVKLVDAIDLQIAAIKAEQQGQPFKRTVNRFFTNSEGQREEATVPVRFRPWWWKDAAGHVFLEIRYANKPVEIKQNKPTIAVGTTDKLIPILEQIRKAALAGELDRQLVAIISTRRKELKRPVGNGGNGNGNGAGHKAAK